MGQSQNETRAGSLRGWLLIYAKAYTKNFSNSYRATCRRSIDRFMEWRATVPYTNRCIREHPRQCVEMFRDYLFANNYSPATVHTYIAGICCAFGISMAGITHHGTAEDKQRSLGNCERSRRALANPKNARFVAFQRMVGGRRTALQRLRGCDFVQDESGEWCVRFVRDKGGKDQLQRIAPENVEAVRAYFDAVGPDDLLFPDPIDPDLDINGLRAEHAHAEYTRYAAICRTPEGRARMRAQLLARFTNPEIGCKAYRLAKAAGNKTRAKKILAKFKYEMRDGDYNVRGHNFNAAVSHKTPTTYDRLALCCVSVFALSHWRNAVTVKHYMV